MKCMHSNGRRNCIANVRIHFPIYTRFPTSQCATSKTRNMSSVTKQAIQNRRKLCLRYSKQTCVVEPYAFGLDKNGAPLLLGYQTEEEGNSNSTEQWKIYSFVDLVSIDLLQQSFVETRPSYVPNHPIFDVVLIQI